MPVDPYTNARPYFTVTFPSSGDGFSISGFRNNFLGLGFLDMIPLQPRARNPADTKIMVRGRDSSSFYNPIYAGDSNKRVFFGSGDSPAFTAPTSNPRIDIVYLTPSGDLKIQQGTEAASPTLPSLAPSGDTRFPICAVYNRVAQTKIVNFEDKDSNTGDGYIYQDLRPWLQQPNSGGAQASSTAALSATGSNAAGTNTAVSRVDHTHQGVHTIRKVGSSDMFGDVGVEGPGVTQATQRLIFNVGYALGNFTRDMTAATGSQVVTGLSFKPRVVLFLAMVDSTQAASWGQSDATTDNALGSDGVNAADTYSDRGSQCIYLATAAGASQTATLSSLNNDGFTVSWTKTGAPTGTGKIYYLALA